MKARSAVVHAVAEIRVVERRAQIGIRMAAFAAVAALRNVRGTTRSPLQTRHARAGFVDDAAAFVSQNCRRARGGVAAFHVPNFGVAKAGDIQLDLHFAVFRVVHFDFINDLAVFRFLQK